MLLQTRPHLWHRKKFRRLLIGLTLSAFLLGVVIVPVELMHPDAKITTVPDGLYWAITTMTTVGYGDMYPLTYGGKVISIMLQLVGALLFGVTIAMMGAFMDRSQEEYYMGRLFERLNLMDEQLSDMKKRTEYLVKHQHLEDSETDV